MAYLDFDGLSTYDGLIKAEISGKIDVGGRTGGIPYGNVDSTSTSTKFTATVDGLTELYDGACVMLHNGVVTSAKGFTVNVNGLGAKKCYSNMTNATQETTVFNANYTLMFVYSTALDSGNGGWWIYRGYDANTTYTPVKLGFGYGHCTTAAATAAKAVAISGYVLNTGGIVSVLFDHDVQAGATLNVTSKGAKAIYYKGAAITNGVIKAGDTATFVYSTQYHLISIDHDAYTLPAATTDTLGGVKVDGTTITATDGVISAVGGEETTAMTDQEVSDAFDLGWVSTNRTVTVTLTGPNHSSDAYDPACILYESYTGEAGNNGYAHGNQIGSISSPTGTADVSVQKSLYGIVASFQGSGVYLGGVSANCTGGITEVGTSDDDLLLKVDGDGTATISNVDYDF